MLKITLKKNEETIEFMKVVFACGSSPFNRYLDAIIYV